MAALLVCSFSCDNAALNRAVPAVPPCNPELATERRVAVSEAVMKKLAGLESVSRATLAAEVRHGGGPALRLPVKRSA